MYLLIFFLTLYQIGGLNTGQPFLTTVFAYSPISSNDDSVTESTFTKQIGTANQHKTKIS